MSDMVERVARAMFADTNEGPWESERYDNHHIYLSNARAAIKAMREPTEAMMHVAWAIADGEWQAMIDAALEADSCGGF